MVPYNSFIFLLVLFYNIIKSNGDVQLITNDFINNLEKNQPNKAVCGLWMEPYARLHSNMLKGYGTSDSKPRKLVFIPNLSGLADRIVGCATVLLLAIATDRAMQIGNRKELEHLEMSFTSPYINWTRSQDPDWLIEPLKHKAIERNYKQEVLDTKEFYGLNTIDNYKLQDALLRSELNELFGGEKVENVMISINRGKTIRLFENSHHTTKLTKLGLEPATAFGCAINYLLKPKPEIFLPLLKQIEQLSNKNTLKISVQIRAGDEILNNNGDINIDSYNEYFRCAKDIENFALYPGQTAVWYLLTDSQKLRQAAVNKFGDKIITSLSTTIEHSSKEANAGCTTNCKVSQVGFHSAAAEWWLMGYTDYHVITKYSGYGRTAGMRSLRKNSIYTIQNGGKNVAVCDEKSFTDLENLSYDWSGI